MAARPVRLLIEFDDGTVEGERFESLPSPLQSELLRQPFASRPGSDSGEDSFLLLEWEDGWKEVLRLPPGSREFNRYYVLSRPEDVGRLSVKKEGGYPELVEVIRRPSCLVRMTLGDSFALQPGRREREGRKVEQHYDLVPQPDAVTELRARLGQLVQQGVLESSHLSSPDEEVKQRTFRTIVSELGLRPSHNRQDVLDYAAYLLREAATLGGDGLAATTGGGQ